MNNLHFWGKNIFTQYEHFIESHYVAGFFISKVCLVLSFINLDDFESVNILLNTATNVGKFVIVVLGIATGYWAFKGARKRAKMVSDEKNPNR